MIIAMSRKHWITDSYHSFWCYFILIKIEKITLLDSKRAHSWQYSFLFLWCLEYFDSYMCSICSCCNRMCKVANYYQTYQQIQVDSQQPVSNNYLSSNYLPDIITLTREKVTQFEVLIGHMKRVSQPFWILNDCSRDS